ncbi:aspartate/glutamate racemase family protein [Tatumella ptyseos]|uniref:aspartate/glutamate racemase family protein n=1 Tax=Tatumella ptyseos TaxID=82987 RepID=UPI0026EDB896|nr:amino acid racemase [Tatumella ptyseos]WKX27993.1 amino acid racemase [Tatumella ptyseos]
MLYYRKFVYQANKRKGALFFPKLTIDSVNVYDVLAMCEQQDYRGLVGYLEQAVQNLVAAGAEVVALTGNTPHIVFDALQDRVSVPMVSIITSVSQRIRQRGLRTVGLIGTGFTMRADFFKKPLREAGINVVIPAEHEITYIADKIHDELEQGIIDLETRDEFIAIIKRMAEEQGIEAIILGCTELPLLFDGISLPVTPLDTVEIHIDALFNALEQ